MSEEEDVVSSGCHIRVRNLDLISGVWSIFTFTGIRNVPGNVWGILAPLHFFGISFVLEVSGDDAQHGPVRINAP